MISALPMATTRRVWFVPDFMVWGLPSLGDVEYLAQQEVTGEDAILFGSAAIGDTDQSVLYEQLIDHRGNHLPAELSAPRVFTRVHGEDTVYVVGAESADGFRIARSPEASGSVSADLMIIELGN